MATNFLKMHGAGNDVVVIMANSDDPLPATTRVRELAHRRTGIGFDQLIWVTPEATPGIDAHYRIYNADGSEVEQCGNGARCLARAWHDHTGAGPQLTFSSPAGPIEAEITGNEVALNMGPPRRPAADLPSAANDPSPLASIEALGQAWPLWLVSMGNPHAVLLVDDVRTAPVAALGPALQQHPAFPAAVNVGFLAVTARNKAMLRVYERGSGETLACGSGACAAAVAGRLAGHLDERVTLTLPGGDLVVSWRGLNDPVWLRGPADYAYHGTLDL
ncbi:MAG: diaminopimelate epimerase [Pseudomonadota bacterium]